MVPNTMIATKPPITIMVAAAAKRQRLVSFIAFNIIINNADSGVSVARSGYRTLTNPDAHQHVDGIHKMVCNILLVCVPVYKLVHKLYVWGS
tara:strand:+ start:1285 stop:1560 length:276 start_codon:yes stop_codon:yes gene_type:complete